MMLVMMLVILMPVTYAAAILVAISKSISSSSSIRSSKRGCGDGVDGGGGHETDAFITLFISPQSVANAPTFLLAYQKAEPGSQ